MNWKEIALKAVRESILIRLPKNERETLEAVFVLLEKESYQLPLTQGTYGNQGASLHIDTTQTINETQEDEPKEDFVEKFGEELKHPHEEPTTQLPALKRGTPKQKVCKICGDPVAIFTAYGKQRTRTLCLKHYRNYMNEQYQKKKLERKGQVVSSVETVKESKPDADINGAYETLRQAYLRHGHIPGVVSHNVAKKFGMNSGEVKLLAAEAVAGR